MRKYSQRHGWMLIRTYASGDGSISVAWVGANDRNGNVLGEIVTESDLSEFLRIPENAEKWKGWIILNLSTVSLPQNRLVRYVERPFHTSCKLKLGDNVYRYNYDKLLASEMGHGFEHNLNNTTFLDEDNEEVKNGEVVASLCFFLNNEGFFDERKAREGF
jgi:hypothetical protein